MFQFIIVSRLLCLITMSYIGTTYLVESENSSTLRSALGTGIIWPQKYHFKSPTNKYIQDTNINRYISIFLTRQLLLGTWNQLHNPCTNKRSLYKIQKLKSHPNILNHCGPKRLDHISNCGSNTFFVSVEHNTYSKCVLHFAYTPFPSL